MYTSAKTRKKRRHVRPTCLKIPGESTAMYLCMYGYVRMYVCMYVRMFVCCNVTCAYCGMFIHESVSTYI